MRMRKGRSQEQQFYQERQSRIRELFFLFRVMREFIRGFRVLHFAKPCVAVFGSARFGESHPYYKLGLNVGKMVHELLFTVMTGGGPGIMEATSRGAFEMGGNTIGCNIQLPMEQQPNPYLKTSLDFKYFFVRKVLMFKYSHAFIILPGGVGTVDEFFEALTLIQTRKVEQFPVVLMGIDFWRPITEQLELFDRENTAKKAEIPSLLVTDDLEEARLFLENFAVQPLITRNPRNYKPLSWLGEGQERL